MEEALEYFKKMGFPIKDGLIDVNSLTEEQIQLLIKWKNETRDGAILMPKINDFYRSVLLVISTNPQKDSNDKIRYLLGKGIGTEIALRGKVEGRKKYNTNPKYRSHADFELYDAHDPKTEVFYEIYGAQEYYPEDNTKGLYELESGLLDNTCEVVDLDGYKVLIPQLEILFADKFLRNEKNPRSEGFDCELLAKEYNLDYELIKNYLEKYYFKVMKKTELKNQEPYKEDFEKNIIENIENLLEINDGDLEFAVDDLNESIELSKPQARKMELTKYGINVLKYIPISKKDIIKNEDGSISLTEDYIITLSEDFINNGKLKLR